MAGRRPAERLIPDRINVSKDASDGLAWSKGENYLGGTNCRRPNEGVQEKDVPAGRDHHGLKVRPKQDDG